MFTHLAGTLRRLALAGTALAGLIPTARAEVPSAARIATRPVSGLQETARIIVDHWGIPHIFAANTHDAFFLQGYNAARDRLWQIDLWRKRGLGLLAKDFGPSFLDQDRAARKFVYRGDIDQEWQAYGPNAKTYSAAFIQGINAFVQETRAGTQPLPAEFRIAGSLPDTWSLDDVVRVRSHGLTRNVLSEVRRAQVACATGSVDADRLRVKLDPAWTTTVPAGLDPCSIPGDVLRDYDLATRNAVFTAPGKRADAYDPASQFERAASGLDAIGSNNWVVAGARTATGRPILANDPHREHSVPSLRYIVQLNAPGMNVIGAGEPALPGISIGHNERIAFGLTIFAADQEDLYVYELNPANPGQYRFNGAWEDMRVVRELVEVKGQPPRELELQFTRHGPVLAADPSKNLAFALRSVWFEPGTSAYFGSSDYMTAQNWRGFLAAMSRWGAPSENQVYADVDGNIGWVPGGTTPRRVTYDGLMPVPGDGRYEWQGFVPNDQLPRSFNPAAGYIATANQMNLPPDYPIAERRIGFDQWADPSRWQRIVEILAARSKLTLADAMDLQNDDTSMLGRRLVTLVQRLTSDDPDTALGLQLIKAWDGRSSRDSAGGAVFEVWVTKHLGPALVTAATPAPARALVGNGGVTPLFDLLEQPDASLGTDPVGARNAILLQSIGSAVAEIRKALGDDPANWTWGRLHHAQFDHALMPLADASMQTQMRVGPLEIGGGANIPHATSYRPSDFALIAGASFRMVLDVGNWDASRAINTPGQSGDPLSPHYRDLAPLWADGRYVPLLFSRSAVENAASQVIELVPGK